MTCFFLLNTTTNAKYCTDTILSSHQHCTQSYHSAKKNFSTYCTSYNTRSPLSGYSHTKRTTVSSLFKRSLHCRNRKSNQLLQTFTCANLLSSLSSFVVDPEVEIIHDSTGCNVLHLATQSTVHARRTDPDSEHQGCIKHSHTQQIFGTSNQPQTETPKHSKNARKFWPDVNRCVDSARDAFCVILLFLFFSTKDVGGRYTFLRLKS